MEAEVAHISNASGGDEVLGDPIGAPGSAAGGVVSEQEHVLGGLVELGAASLQEGVRAVVEVDVVGRRD
jgi:hypothetical protein